MASSCPICYHRFSLPDLAWHVNSHFNEDQLVGAMELDQQIAMLQSPPRVTDNSISCEEDSVTAAPEASASRSDKDANDYQGIYDQDMLCLSTLQIRSDFYKVEGGLMTLLKWCLELEHRKSISIICSHVDHFQSIDSESSGWGCGWRNIQMLSSHLLRQRQEARQVMFGGAGFVPDIPSLQRWLEIAWQKGFDISGSNSFSQRVYGTRKWIGTTECASLLRLFGLRARIVDFGSKANASLSSQFGVENTKAKSLGCNREREKVFGPMDEFLLTKRCGGYACHTLTDKNKNKSPGMKIDGHQLLIDWVWNYFTDGAFCKMHNFYHVFVSDRTPLYFQHHGHSRTIVGIQRQNGLDGMPDQHFLLVLDPAHRTADLERSLREKMGWQKLLKRGIHTLKKPLYQLCYVDPGVAHGEELELLKTIDSIFLQF